MSQTPETLQQKFNIPADLGTVKVPRSPHAFQGVHPGDRRTFLSSYYPLVMSGAIAAEGQHPSSVRGARVGVTQAQMAERAGVHRTTVTRRMSKLAAPAKGYEDARRRRAKAQSQVRNALVQLELHKDGCAACAAALPCATKSQLEIVGNRQIPGLEHYDRPEPTAVLFRRRRFGMASRYGVRMMQRREQWCIVETSTGAEIKRFLRADLAARACDRLQTLASERAAQYGTPATLYQVEAVAVQVVSHRAPSPAELAADPITGAWWNPADKADGYKARSRWVFDPRILNPETGRTLDTLPRLVMSYYEGCGLLEEWRDDAGNVTKPAGMLTIGQRTVARALGCSVKSVYKANQVWKRLEVLRFVTGETRQTEKGTVRGVSTVYYLPFRMLTEAEAEAEAARMAAKAREFMASKYAAELFGRANALEHTMEGLRVHGELLAAWRGREHCLRAFYRECARRMHSAGVSPEAYTYFLPPTAPGRWKAPPGPSE